MTVLTVAVPIFNMEWCLEKNLATYDDPRLEGRLEVLCLNNASEDRSREIVERYVKKRPGVFRLMDRPTRGYGSAINAALAEAKGKYFRIVDADDWVDTGALAKQLDHLAGCGADVVLTNYSIVNLQSGEETPVINGQQGIAYDRVYTTLDAPTKTLPTIHGTTYRTALLRDSGFSMQDGIFFVDEAYVILPYLSAGSVVYLDLDIYRYAVANPEQSTSPKNRGRLQSHREQVLTEIIERYEAEKRRNPENPALDYCAHRIARGMGDHFTTLYFYVEDRPEGRRLAKAWRAKIQRMAPEFWPCVRRKAAALSMMNRLGLPLPAYLKLKKVFVN